MDQLRPREVHIGHFANANEARRAAFMNLRLQLQRYPYAPSVTIRWQGPHEQRDRSIERLHYRYRRKERYYSVSYVYAHNAMPMPGKDQVFQFVWWNMQALDLQKIETKVASLKPDMLTISLYMDGESTYQVEEWGSYENIYIASRPTAGRKIIECNRDY